MTIEKARMTFEQAKEAYYGAIRSNIMNTLVKSLNDNGLSVDTESMTYKYDDILTEEKQKTASEAELERHDNAFDKVEEIFDSVAEAVYTMLRQTDIDEWCEIDTSHYCNNALELAVVFDGMEYSILVRYKS